jgi:hypothetical protein
MKVQLGPEIAVRIARLRAEVERLEKLQAAGVQLEIRDARGPLAETEKLDILQGSIERITMEHVHELIAFTVEMAAVCQQAGARHGESLTQFVERRLANAKRSSSALVH